jgi:CheY-like chemotaxis protein
MTERRRLCIADDDPRMRWLVRSVLRDEFDELIEACDGRQLLWELFRSTYADHVHTLIVTDVCMPVYNGLDVLEACEELQYAPRVLVITSFPSPATRARVQRLGGRLLAKPFTTAQLRDAVHEAIA